MSEASRPRVVLADDFLVVAEHLRALLECDFEVVATVADGLALLEAVETYQPDVIVSDIAMPGLDGIAAARAIRTRNANARIVFVTVHDDAAVAALGFSVGALGYVSKSVAGDELVTAVYAALRGERYISPSVGSPLKHPDAKT